MKPQDPKVVRPTFETVYSEALVLHTMFTRTATHALSIGVRPEDLIRYVRGDCLEHERDEIHFALKSSPWAMARVVALVKAARTPGSLGAELLSSPHTDLHSRCIENTGDRDLDMCRLLESV